jgi:hypothetical protein
LPTVLNDNNDRRIEKAISPQQYSALKLSKFVERNNCIEPFPTLHKNYVVFGYSAVSFSSYVAGAQPQNKTQSECRVQISLWFFMEPPFGIGSLSVTLPGF